MTSKHKQFKKGDTVKFLNEKGGGIVSKLTKEYVFVEVEDNFEIPVLYSEVILVSSNKEHSSNQQNNNDEVEQTAEFVKKPISYQTTSLSKGIYLLFVPINQDILIAGDFMLYLLNYTNYSGYFSFFFQQLDSKNATYKGEFDNSAALLLDTISANDIASISKGVFQCIYTSELRKGLLNPTTAIFDVKPNKFIKEESFVFNPALQLKALTVKLIDASSISMAHSFAAKDDVNILTPTKAEVEEHLSLISKYKTAHLEAEVDLHFDKIVANKKKMANTDKMRVQLELCKNCIESAIEEGYKRVVFIHGVGVGILKIEIHNLLNNYEQLEYRDAPISQYGIGATEVLIYKKSK
jgi:hypothetical protein